MSECKKTFYSIFINLIRVCNSMEYDAISIALKNIIVFYMHAY